MSEKIYTIEETEQMLKEILQDKPVVYKVILFGSYAKKEAKKVIQIW